MGKIITWCKKGWYWLKQKKGHYLFAIFTFFAGWVAGMLTTPFIGALFTAIALYLTLVIFIPWDKIKWLAVFHKVTPYIMSAIVVIAIILPMWNILINIFPSNNPYRELIRTATATVEVTIRSSEDVNTRYISEGGYLAFMINSSNALLLVSGPECYGKQIGEDRVLYHGTFDLDTIQIYTKNHIYVLKYTEYIQIGFEPIPDNSQILGGKAVVTLNNSVRIEVDIPTQKMTSDYILIKDVQECFQNFKK